MSASVLQRLRERRAEREAANLARELALPRGVDFTSNDYLGFATDPGLQVRLREVLGAERTPFSPGSRLLRGEHPLHGRLETKLAQWKGTASARLFTSGYLANLALFSAVVERADLVVSDVLNHASIIDALRLTGAERAVVPHLDLAAVEAALDRPARGRRFVVTESLFGMDGDQADLSRLLELCEGYEAALIVDDSHAAGLYGDRGSGLTEDVAERLLAVVSTFGKSLAVGGAMVGGPAEVTEALLDAGRAFIFTTAMPPWQVAAVDASLDHLALHLDRGPRARARAAELRRALSLPEADGPIVPLLLGDNARALSAAEAIQAEGYDVRAVRPPTVPEGTARLRISVHADRSETEVAGLASVLMRWCR